MQKRLNFSHLRKIVLRISDAKQTNRPVLRKIFWRSWSTFQFGKSFCPVVRNSQGNPIYFGLLSVHKGQKRELEWRALCSIILLAKGTGLHKFPA